MSESGETPRVSIVVPVFEEFESLVRLADEIRNVAELNALSVELIFIDDGSSDTSWSIIEELVAQDSRIRGIRLRRNFGKAAALDAGYRASRGDVVFQMDADLQDDPAEIPAFLSKLEEGFDVVNGWKKQRHDPWHKVWPSRVFNWTVSKVMGPRLHDHNCGLKCFRHQVVNEIQLYGELHRFIPVIAHARGFRVAEVVVQHRAREFGKSKYGTRRFMKGLLDLMTVTFLFGFGRRPQHLLGGCGLICFAIGTAGLTYLSAAWLFARLEWLGFAGHKIGDRPLLAYSIAAVLLGFHMFSIGFLAELILAMNIKREQNYSVAERIGADE